MRQLNIALLDLQFDSVPNTAAVIST